MIDIKFSKQNEHLKEMLPDFIKLVQRLYPKMLEFNHYEMWKNTNQSFSPEDWKKFRLSESVNNWYEQELSIQVDSKIFKLIQTIGDDNSTAKAQMLNNVLAYASKDKKTAKEPTIFVFNFIPLNYQEELAPNVRIIENIPIEIGNAIQHITRNNNKE